MCVWYSPWQHQNEANPLIPLVHEIQSQFTAFQKIRGKLNELNRQGGLAVTNLLEHLADAAATFFLGKNVKLMRGMTDAIQKGWQESEPNLTRVSDGQRFHLLFSDEYFKRRYIELFKDMTKLRSEYLRISTHYQVDDKSP